MTPALLRACAAFCLLESRVKAKRARNKRRGRGALIDDVSPVYKQEERQQRDGGMQFSAFLCSKLLLTSQIFN
ncbi:hypothetical protein Anapl_05046 [Anas platyrhynchos]|uniref:Uncharacterized protein n=1 Tax=Anas platyrhynchos TaxID=8839 RepID=R0KVD4_ANAPL|nr:hypothetical protein Anapl_05046 [Anas platyrhynchos]